MGQDVWQQARRMDAQRVLFGFYFVRSSWIGGSIEGAGVFFFQVCIPLLNGRREKVA